MRTSPRPTFTLCRTTSLAIALVAMGSTVGEAEAAVAYVRSTVGQPWGSGANEQAMDQTFGVGGWDDLRFETVDAATLFSASYTFVYLEGSDLGAEELAAFLAANQTALADWVDAGGSVFLNAAPNEGGSMAWGFGGVTLVYPGFPTDPGSAADAMHPIWNGPFLPTSPAAFTGGSFAHAQVTGPGLVPVIVDSDGGDPHLAELAWGSGRAMFGGLTVTDFWEPNPESVNLRANILAYLSTPGAFCGNGAIEGGEVCDDAGDSAMCDGDCTLASCGDGYANAAAAEACDDAGESAMCNLDCTLAVCGDAVINASAGEDCDDGNTDDGDGCSASCTVESGTGSDSGGEGSTAGGASTGGEGSTGAGASTGGEGSTGGVASTGGDASTGGADTSGGGEAGSTGAIGSTGEPGSTGAGEGSGDTTSGGSSPGTGGGCGCVSDGGGSRSPISILALVGLFGLRRRRRSQRLRVER